MPNSLSELFDQDQEALKYFHSLPAFAQNQILESADQIRTKEELGGRADQLIFDALSMEAYAPMFEDEIDSAADWL